MTRAAEPRFRSSSERRVATLANEEGFASRKEAPSEPFRQRRYV
jgi:hypothetical protein